MPNDFLSIAEDTGLIVPIGDWVIAQSCLAAATLNKALGRALVMAVNMSSRPFRDRGLVQMILNALEESRLPAHCLELEITEGILLQSSAETHEVLNRLHEMGVRVLIDDFGTGYSSMVYVSQFAIDRIKIDQSVVQKALTEKNSRAVIKGIVAMAHESGIKVIGEGTATLDEARLLRGLICDEGQGYLFSRPADEGRCWGLLRLGIGSLSWWGDGVTFLGWVLLPKTRLPGNQGRQIATTAFIDTDLHSFRKQRLSRKGCSARPGWFYLLNQKGSSWLSMVAKSL